MTTRTIKQIVGKTVASWHNNDNYELYIKFTDGFEVCFYHQQDCCESVGIEDITGDLNDLIGHPLLVAEERVGGPEEQPQYGSETWTFYTFRSNGGSVDIRWVGESNGYYSEDVDLAFRQDEGEPMNVNWGRPDLWRAS